MSYSEYEINDFVIEVIEQLISPIFGSDADPLHENKQLAQFLTAACELHSEQRYDLAKCDFDSMSHVCEQVLFLIAQLRVHPNQRVFVSNADMYLKLEKAIRATWVFISLNHDVPVPSNFSIQDISAATGLKESTLRNVIPGAFADSRESRQEAISASGRLPSITIYDSENDTDDLHFDEEQSIDAWILRIKRRATGRGIDWQELAPLLPTEEQSFDAFIKWAKEKPEKLLQLADQLSFSRKSFIANSIATLLKDFERQAKEALNAIERAHEVTPLQNIKSSDAPIEPLALRDLMITQYEAKVHPKYGDNKKLIGLQLSDGRTVAIETSKKPQLWIDTASYRAELEPYLVKHYAKTTESESTYQRHSGLKLYPALATAAVTKLRIKNYGEAFSVLNLLR